MKNHLDELKSLRNQIDNLDAEVLKLLIKRFEIIKKIGNYKKKHNLPVLQKSRTESIINKVKLETQKCGYPSEFFEKIYKSIIKSSCNVQNEILKESEE